MKILKTMLVASLGTYFGTLAVAAQPGDASAALRREHSSICTFASDNLGSNAQNDTYLSNDTASAQYVYCPFVSDSTLLHNNVTSVNVYGNNSTADAGSETRACAKSTTGFTVDCGTWESWNVVNGQVITTLADLAAWTDNASWYPFLQHRMMPGTDLYGFYSYGD